MVCEQIRSEATTTKEKEIKKKTKIGGSNKEKNNWGYSISEWLETLIYTGIKLSGWIQGVAINKKSIECVFYFLCFKDNVKTAHCVGHLQLRSLDTDDFF